MNNYVVTFQLSDEKTKTKVESKLLALRPARHETLLGLSFYAFAAKDKKQATNKLETWLKNAKLADDDYVAMMHRDPKNENHHKRVMLEGKAKDLDKTFDDPLEKANYINLVNNLLNSYFTKRSV